MTPSLNDEWLYLFLKVNDGVLRRVRRERAVVLLKLGDDRLLVVDIPAQRLNLIL